MNTQETGAFTALPKGRIYVFVTKEEEIPPNPIKKEPVLYVGQLEQSTPLEPIHYIGIGLCFILLIGIVIIWNKLKYEKNEFRKQSNRNSKS